MVPWEVPGDNRRAFGAGEGSAWGAGNSAPIGPGSKGALRPVRIFHPVLA
jgi:hypothetical protein